MQKENVGGGCVGECGDGGAHIYMWTPKESRAGPQACFSVAHYLMPLGQEISNLKLNTLARLAGQEAPMIHLSLPLTPTVLEL